MTTAPTSLVSTLKMGKQTAKGTPLATTGYVCGRFTGSSMQAIYDYIDADSEHFCGVGSRATIRKVKARKANYIVPWGGQGYLYPDFLGMCLIGMGFTDTPTVADTSGFLHTMVLGAMSSAPYMTVLHSIGDGGAKFERRAKDARVEMLRIDAGARGSMMTFSGFGLTEDIATGSEVAVNEPDAMMLPSKGSATITIGGAAFTSPFRGFRAMFSNPLSKTEQQMFALEHDDIPLTGFDVGGTLMQLDLDYDTYRKLSWPVAGGGTGGTGPTSLPVTGTVDVTFQSNELAGVTAPYSVQMILPSVEIRMGQFQAKGRDLIRFDLAFMMVDDVATPITMKITDKKATF